MWWPITCHGQFCWKLTDCNHWAVDCCLSFQNCKWNLHFAQVSLKIFDLIYCLKRPNPQFSNLQSRVHQDSPETHSKSSTWNQCQWSWRAGWARFRVNHEWQSLDMLDHVVSAGHPAPVVTPENWKWPHWTQTVFFFFFFFCIHPQKPPDQHSVRPCLPSAQWIFYEPGNVGFCVEDWNINVAVAPRASLLALIQKPPKERADWRSFTFGWCASHLLTFSLKASDITGCYAVTEKLRIDSDAICLSIWLARMRIQIETNIDTHRQTCHWTYSLETLFHFHGSLMPHSH